jgi:hypothetical protein
MGKWTKENFKRYHAENPQVYDYFKHFALMVTNRREFYSAKCIFHRVRWETMISGIDDEYKIDDGWISHYARKFMEDYPEHEGFFKTRNRKNSYHYVEEGDEEDELTEEDMV